MGQDYSNFCSTIEEERVQLCSLSVEDQRHSASCLQRPADYKCGVCGLKARMAENCCDPVQLPEMGSFGDAADNLYVEKTR